MTPSTVVPYLGYEINAFAVAIIIFFLILLIAIARAQFTGKLDWTDMLTRDGTKVSTTKLLQLVGGGVASWVVIKLAITKDLNVDIFVTYLMYIAGSDGYAKYIMARYGQAGSDDSTVTYHPPAPLPAVTPPSLDQFSGPSPKAPG